MSEAVPETMKALVKREEKESYVLQEIPVPDPRGDEVLIKVESVSICGSDISLYRWNEVARVIATIPFIPGHECAGVVVKAGPDSPLAPGTRVGVENHFYCGSCYQCTHDQREICQNMGQYGHGKKTFHGGCSQYSIVSAKFCYPLKTNITSEEAVLLEPLGVAHNAVERLEVVGEDVLVIGCGPVGLLATATAKALGATRVFGVDIDESRLGLAKTLGADVLINSAKEDIKSVVMGLTNGDGVGRIAECSGAASMISSMFTYLRKGGHVVMVGLPKQPIHVEDPLPNVVFKGVTLKTVHGRLIYHTWEETERLTAEKKVNSLAVVSHRIPMSRFEDAFEALFSGKACKIILDPHK